MRHCQKCKGKRILSITAKCSDLCVVENAENMKEHQGYVPSLPNIGGNDYIRMKVCLDCGQIQGGFPIKTPESLTIGNERCVR